MLSSQLMRTRRLVRMASQQGFTARFGTSFVRMLLRISEASMRPAPLTVAKTKLMFASYRKLKAPERFQTTGR